MPKPTKPAKDDVSVTAERLVREALGTERENAEDLIGDPETRRKFREAKEKEAKRLTKK